jgi:hypothetical protein
MTADKGEQDGLEVFFQILLLGQLMTPSQMEGQKKHIGDILQESGIKINSSDVLILDQSRIGNSTITIARYTLDYVRDKEAIGKRVCVEGTVTLQTDKIGNTIIRVSSKADPFRPYFKDAPFEASLISSNL